MHRSRIGVVLVDHPEPSHDRAAAFWAGAVGGEVTADDDTYSSLGRLPGGVRLEAQRLASGGPRIHLDIETDDTEAEASRLEALGAVRVGGHDGCVHLQDPAGLVFCVVPVQSADFESHATVWE